MGPGPTPARRHVASRNEKKRRRKEKEKVRRESNRNRRKHLLAHQGFGVIAYLDLLGFSRAALSDWSPDFIAKVHRLRAALLKRRITFIPAQGSDASSSALNAVTQFFSDSIALSAIAQKESDIWWCIINTTMSVHAFTDACAREGFAVRGCVEWGNCYRSPTELMGPPFITACEVEKRVCKYARVIVGPDLLELMSRFADTENVIQKGFLSVLTRCEDGLIAVRPDMAGALFSGENPLAQKLRALREQAPEEARWKYDWAIAQAASTEILPELGVSALKAGRRAMIDILSPGPESSRGVS